MAKILFLASDAHGGFGGVSQYNRDVLEALSRMEGVQRIDVLARIATTPLGPTPPRVHYDLSSLGGRAKYFAAAARRAVSGRYDLIYCAHINLLPAAALAKSLCKAPLALAIYGIDVWKDLGVFTRSLVKAHVDAVLSISQVTLDRFQAWAAAAPEKCHVLPNAIHLEDYAAGPPSPDLQARLGLKDAVVLMTMGRMVNLERYKGFDEMIEVLPTLQADIPNAKLLFVGDGDDRVRLAQKAANAGLKEHVVFTGRISDAEKAETFRLADAYVMPSRGEGFGFVMLEAMASGVPVVASALDGTREAVLDGKLGPVADPGDPAALHQAILTALQMPRGVPEGLSHFAFPNFQARLRAALTPAVPGLT